VTLQQLFSETDKTNPFNTRDMTDSSKIKLLVGTTVLLIILNVIIVGFIWFGAHAPRPLRDGRGPGPDRAELIIHELKLDETQRKQFEQLRDEHHHIIMAVNEKDRRTHQALFDLVKNGQDNTAASDSLINEIAENKKQIEQATYHHLAEVRKICTPEQQKIFDDIIINLFRRGPDGPPPGRRPE
jgi:Spy/CpxP family protein refolding chaperone